MYNVLKEKGDKSGYKNQDQNDNFDECNNLDRRSGTEERTVDRKVWLWILA